MGYRSKKVDSKTDEIIKEMKTEFRKQGIQKSEIDIIRENIKEGAEKMNIEVEEEEDDFMDVFK